MGVTREDLHAALERVRARVDDPRAGIHGPGTVSWRVNREAGLFLGGGRAALLQIAHPYVAHAVDQHSQTRADVQGRFTRTFTNVYAMAFGDLEAALTSARRVHRVHTRIRGRITEDVGRYRAGHVYEANDEHALLWVHATLVDSALQAYERVVRPVSPEDRQRYLDESTLFAYLFGIPDPILPPTWGDFRAYFDRMVRDELAVGAPARDLARFLLAAPSTVHRPAMRLYRILTAGLLPAPLREPYGLRFGPVEHGVFEAALGAGAPAYRLVPRRLRYMPAYVEASRRMRGREGPDRFGRTLERLLVRGLGSPSGREAA